MNYFKLLSYAGLCALMSCESSTRTPEHSSKAESISPTGENTLVQHPDWSKDASIYEVNIRQHTPDGTFNAFIKEMPKINDLGSEILWIMPIQPIGIEKRKARGDLFIEDIEDVNERKKYLGSYYSISDYTGINPEFGTLNDFKRLVNEAHKNNQKVILDWVPNHTSWDNVWMKDHKDWYTQNDSGLVIPPNPDWGDVADLNYSSDSMRLAMIDAMKYWIIETEIDGFRCDVAMEVPIDFWEQASKELHAVKPDIFMLAEAEVPEHHEEVFDMSYGWYAHHVFNHIATQEWPLDSLIAYMEWEKKNFTTNDYRMMFTTNHDENSWNGTVFSRMGENHKAMAVLAFTYYGMPLVYSGQEVGNDKQLKFFEKDSINASMPELHQFYKTLITAKKQNKALWNGTYGGAFERLTTSHDGDVLCFTREKDGNKIITVINLSAKDISLNIEEKIEGTYKSIFNEETLSIYTSSTKSLAPHGYQVFVKQ